MCKDSGLMHLWRRAAEYAPTNAAAVHVGHRHELLAADELAPVQRVAAAAAVVSAAVLSMLPCSLPALCARGVSAFSPGWYCSVPAEGSAVLSPGPLDPTAPKWIPARRSTLTPSAPDGLSLSPLHALP